MKAVHKILVTKEHEHK